MLKQALQYIHQLEFDYIIRLMMNEKYFLPPWESAEVLHCRKLYKRFLILNKKYPNEIIVPTREIDEFWHNHILHTQEYYNDCMAIFGHYRHHTPSSATDEEIKILKNGSIKTQELYFLEFSEYL